MDYSAIASFANTLLETTKNISANGGCADECIRLANRSADLFNKAVEMSSVKQPVIWSVLLNSFGNNKLFCIKYVKECLNLGLRDAKELVEKAPVAVLTTADEVLAKKLYEKLFELKYSKDMTVQVELQARF